MAAIGTSQYSSFTPDSSKAKSAIASIFGIIDKKSKIDPSDESGTTLDSVKGEIELHRVSFKYPSRPNIHIFRDLGLTIHSGKVADKIQRDERVSIIERKNLRYLKELPQNVDLVTLDLSFISILTVMPAVVNVMKEDAALVTLVKPQFEARRSQVGKGGIVKDPIVHQEVLEKITKGVESFGFCSKGWIESPLKGAEGNTEFLVHFTRIRNKGDTNNEEIREEV